MSVTAHPLAADLRAGVLALGLELSPAQHAALLIYLDQLAQWNRVYNLTALRQPQQMLTHHVLDSLAVLPALRSQFQQMGLERARVLDVGSGAGLPGVVLALAEPALAVTCVDAVAKKAGFVAQVAAALRVPNLHSVHARVEQLVQPHDVVLSRAFASLADFVRCSRASLAPGGVWLALKGKRPDGEIAALPSTIEVFHVEPLQVPGLDAQRCLVWLRRRPSDSA